MNRHIFAMQGISGSQRTNTANFIGSLTTLSLDFEITKWNEDGITYFGSPSPETIRRLGLPSPSIVSPVDLTLCAIVSTDNFFVEDNGVFSFDSSKLREYREKTENNLQKVISLGVPVIIVDESNLSSKDVSKLKSVADNGKYSFSLIKVPLVGATTAAQNCPRGYSKEVISRQIDDYKNNKFSF